jgi:hypothetical protein
MVVYTHPARWWRADWGGINGFSFEGNKYLSNIAQELPFDTIAGPLYDAIDILMIPQEREANEATQRLWFELLNHGYRIPATASSDSTFDRPGGAVPGIVRVYTRVEGDATANHIAAAIRAGRNFVTSGPLLRFSMGGHESGDVVRVNAPASFAVRIEAWASGDVGEHLTRVELIRNGTVIRDFAADGVAWHENFPIEESGSCWYIVRVTGSGSSQIAISDPIYFEAPDYRRPEPAAARVHLTVRDAIDGKPLEGHCDVLRMIGREPKIERTVAFTGGDAVLTAPATARLRISAPGYAPVVKSIFMDTPELLDMARHMSRAQLLDWRTFERIRALLGDVRMQIPLQRDPAAHNTALCTSCRYGG